MKPVIHAIWSVQTGTLRTYVPPDPEDVALWVLLGISPKGVKRSERSDEFVLLVATPSGLRGLPANRGIIAFRHTVVMDRFDYDLLWAWLERTVAECEGMTWRDCLDQLRVRFQWEFD